MKPEALLRRIAGRVPPGPFIIALSGGADSAVAAWALCDRAGAVAVTVDHGLAGSPTLVDAAAAIATHLGLSHHIVAVQPRSASEGDLRVVRLAALEAAGEGWIVTGHTADDQAETVLGNLLRGTGPGGLAGIPWRRGRYLRPLLDVTREETRRLACDLGLPFADDPQNDDPVIRRNHIRGETLPALSAAYNPRLREALGRIARSAAADDDLLGSRAAVVPLRRDEEAVLIPAAALTSLPPAVAARVAMRAVRMLRGPASGDDASIVAILAAAGGEGVPTASGGLDARREGPWLAVSGPAPVPPAAVTIAPPATVRFGPWTITAGAGGVAVPGAGPMLVRPAATGDRISLGSGSKPVVEVLREAGVAPRLRSRWPVIESRGRIAWVVGVRVAPAAGGETVAMSATKERQ